MRLPSCLQSKCYNVGTNISFYLYVSPDNLHAIHSDPYTSYYTYIKCTKNKLGGHDHICEMTSVAYAVITT